MKTGGGIFLDIIVNSRYTPQYKNKKKNLMAASGFLKILAKFVRFFLCWKKQKKQIFLR